MHLKPPLSSCSPKNLDQWEKFLNYSFGEEFFSPLNFFCGKAQPVVVHTFFLPRQDQFKSNGLPSAIELNADAIPLKTFLIQNSGNFFGWYSQRATIFLFPVFTQVSRKVCWYIQGSSSSFKSLLIFSN